MKMIICKSVADILQNLEIGDIFYNSEWEQKYVIVYGIKKSGDISYYFYYPKFNNKNCFMIIEYRTNILPTLYEWKIFKC